MTELYNAAERQHVKQAARQARLVDKQRGEFITNIMDTAPGRSWICDILESAHVFATSHTGNALNTAFAEGERNIGLRILNDLMAACPDQYVTMMRERNARRTASDSRRPAATAADSTSVEPDDTTADGDTADDDDIYTEYGREVAAQ